MLLNPVHHPGRLHAGAIVQCRGHRLAHNWSGLERNAQLRPANYKPCCFAVHDLLPDEYVSLIRRKVRPLAIGSQKSGCGNRRNSFENVPGVSPAKRRLHARNSTYCTWNGRPSDRDLGRQAYTRRRPDFDTNRRILHRSCSFVSDDSPCQRQHPSADQSELLCDNSHLLTEDLRETRHSERRSTSAAPAHAESRRLSVTRQHRFVVSPVQPLVAGAFERQPCYGGLVVVVVASSR